MINNNMDMIKQMQDVFDYNEYLRLCEEKEVQPNDLNRFCMGVGMLAVARHKYPDKDWQEAYKQIMQDMNALEKITQNSKPVEQGKKSSCCGGDKGEKRKPPNLLQRGINLAKATSEHIISGMKHVPPDVYMQRLAICKECPKRLEGFICEECGCYMGIKASWAETKCGLKKW